MDPEKEKLPGDPLVSVIVPAYNADKYISESLESILAQTYRELEIIVVDDGSTDNTLETAEKYQPRVHCFTQKANSGPSAARNLGIQKSSGEFICFMDADDLMTEDRISLTVDFMARHPDVGLAFCDYRNFNVKGLFPQSHFETCPRLSQRLGAKNESVLDEACPILAEENFALSGTFFVRRRMLELEAGFEPTLKCGEDFHFYFRLARHSPVGILNKVGMMHRVHGENLSANVVQMRYDGMRSRTMLRDTEKDALVRADLNRFIVRCKRDLARYYANHGMYFDSVLWDLRALSGASFVQEGARTFKSIVRTIAMGTGLHRPTDE